MKNKNNQSGELKKSILPPIVNSIVSAVLPGAGQMFAREFKRGIVLLMSFITIGGLLAWRISIAGRRYDDLLVKVQKAFYLEPILRVITILFVCYYLWIIIDAFIVSKKRNMNERYRNSTAILFFTIVLFFILGWQIGKIDVFSLVSQADEAVPTLSRVIWPWKSAITYPEEFLTKVAEVQAPCSDTPFPEAEPVNGEAFLHVTPTCGNPSETDGTPGTTYTLTGTDFEPYKEVEIWWRDPISNEFRQRQEGEYVVYKPDENGNFQGDIIMPYRILPPSAGEGPKIWQIQARQLVTVGEAEVSEEL